MKKDNRSIDPTVTHLLNSVQTPPMATAWDRYEAQKPQCGFGELGICCRICYMGPCRIDPFDEAAKTGVCGATADVIVARNFARMIAAGSAAHSDHGRDVAHALLAAAENPRSGYQVKDVPKLRKTAGFFGIPVEGRGTAEIARAVAHAAIAEFGKQDGALKFISRAPAPRQELWKRLGVVPRGIDREIVELMHRTNMGVDQDSANIMLQASRAALADGWGGSMIATELQDILFGTPVPIRGRVNLGVLSKTEVNVVVHGHEPVLSEMIVLAAQDKELLELARANGAAGINIAGICCTANEILLRHGIPIAGNFLQQEMAITTGAVDVMVVDVQCVMASLRELCKCFHTALITTSAKARMEDVRFLPFSEDAALSTAKEIVRTAVLNFPNRRQVDIPREQVELIAGFSHEAITYMLGGTFRGSYHPLNDNIINGRIKGVAGVVGCNNPKVQHDFAHVELVKELIANDILVVQTGCSAIACAKCGLLQPEAAAQFAGPGLTEVCETVGMPPVLHSGACVDNSRVLVALSEMVRMGGLGKDISELPVAGAAPEWMSEKAVAIGQYFVASGVFTVFGVGLPITGSRKFTKLLTEDYEKVFGGCWAVEPEPAKMAALIIDHIQKKRENLGISKARERVLYDMDMRRELTV
jgi:anaerobic carbon-monoxide dehydrogenase catalytic subunit